MTARQENLTRLALWMALLIVPLVTLGGQFVLRPLLFGPGVIDIPTSIAESGGFRAPAIRLRAGQQVTLRFSALDVPHQIAIGPGLNQESPPIQPGKFHEMVVRFDQPGVYTYYCNLWCSPNHWRMRGVIEVTDANGQLPPAPRDPAVDALVAEGVDIDAGIDAVYPPLPYQPSAERGRELLAAMVVPAEVRDPAWRDSHTPAEALTLLSALEPDRTEAELADAVAALWLADAPADVTQAAILYARNCAACHGGSGGGDGSSAKLTAKPPAAFSDPARMFQRRDDVLYAKLRRGGMGTDMPNFGTLFTPEESRGLVDYLRQMAFNR